MNENSVGNLFDYMKDSPEEDKTISEEFEKPFMEGICQKCLGTGFLHTVKDGVLGLAFNFSGEDSTGQRIKKLQVCNCSFKSVRY